MALGTNFFKCRYTLLLFLWVSWLWPSWETSISRAVSGSDIFTSPCLLSSRFRPQLSNSIRKPHRMRTWSQYRWFTKSLCYLLTLTLTEYIGNGAEYDLYETSFRDMGNRKILEIKLGKPDLPAMFLLQLVKELAHIQLSLKNRRIIQVSGQRKICCIDLYE